MDAKDSYKRQIGILDDLRGGLVALRDWLDLNRQSYRRQIDAMAANGFMAEHVGGLDRRFNTYTLLVDSLQDSIAQSTSMLARQEELLAMLANAPD